MKELVCRWSLKMHHNFVVSDLVFHNIPLPGKYCRPPVFSTLFLLLTLVAKCSRGGQGSAANLSARFSTQAFVFLFGLQKITRAKLGIAAGKTSGN
jgi:hypothetical protein